MSLPKFNLLNGFSHLGLIAIVLSFLAILSFGFLYGYRYFTRTPYFQLKTVEIHGNKRLSFREILDIATVGDGMNLLELSIDDVERQLGRNPWVQEVSIARIMPDRLVISLKERDPAFWMLAGGGLHYADARGGLIAPVGSNLFSSLPTLEVEEGAEDAVQALPDLVKNLRESHIPLDMARISQVRLTASRGVELFLEDTGLTITVGFEEWLANLARLGMVITDLQARKELPSIKSIRAQGANVWVEKKQTSAAGSETIQ